MKKKRMRKAVLTLLFVGAVLGGIAAKWYITPISQYTATTLCSQDGEQIDVVFELVRQRYLLSPTKLSGTVTVDGKVYESFHYNYAGSFWDTFLRKFNSHQSFDFAVRVDSMIFWQLESDRLTIYRAGENLGEDASDYICISIIPRGEHSATFYYGPAKTTDNAEKLLARFVKEEFGN